MNGYQLRAAFEKSTGGAWPLNVGQVYSTLGRLERDGLVRALSDADAGDRPYELTDLGHAEGARWFATAVVDGSRPRDELIIKLSLAFTTPGVDVRAVIQTQRRSSMRALQEYTRLKIHDASADLAWRLALQAMVLRSEAEIRWLDHCETSVVHGAAGSDVEATIPVLAAQPS